MKETRPIVVNQPPVIAIVADGGFEALFWMGEDFDYDTPFRGALAQMTLLLGGPEHASLELPPRQDREDFIEGALRFGSGTIRIYYEHSLGYLSLRTDSRDLLEDALARILPGVRVK